MRTQAGKIDPGGDLVLKRSRNMGEEISRIPPPLSRASQEH